MSEAYKQAGVNIAAGNEAVKRMKKHVEKTLRPEVLSGLGGFGGLFALNKEKYEEPVLVSGTDGVGTKLKLAFAMDQHDTIGIDAVAMCVNDILVQGAEPLFFLDYIACGTLLPEKVEHIVKGISEGCQQANCALIGGETAEMPGMYADGEYDIAGFTVGIVDKSRIIDGTNIQEGDIVLGLSSSGVHSNGFSLVRKVLLEEQGLALDDHVTQLGQTLGACLLTPTKIYAKTVLPLLEQINIKGMSHITGGGFIENIPRMLPQGVNVNIATNTWPIPPIFDLLVEKGNMSKKDAYTTFNMGIGYMIVVSPDEKERAMECIQQLGEEVYEIGTVTAGQQDVTFDGVQW
ncbi:phosphoribosylformylglycinamidine cyclo-ligase [Longirhabdus pacifica]|uniref:phosphoribosylformylglycinamidine cyclo-ligase n=1 Tax=Longirhabdus pacifica TaxID=2305227 RepID=UPI0010092651|nr:phosphoribosylformylglycinamidine cyclo-ligase [Longirhabdus pacifica]